MKKVPTLAALRKLARKTWPMGEASVAEDVDSITAKPKRFSAVITIVDHRKKARHMILEAALEASIKAR